MSKPAKKAKTQRVKPYKTYVFTDRDPILDKMNALIHNSGKSVKDLSNTSGVSATTLRSWKYKTKRPQFATINATGRACGYDLKFTPLKK